MVLGSVETNILELSVARTATNSLASFSLATGGCVWFAVILLVVGLVMGYSGNTLACVSGIILMAIFIYNT